MKFHSTILEALNHHASRTPDKVVFTWVGIKCEEQNKMTFKQLQDESNAVAARLLKLGCQKGDRVMIAYPFGLEFLAGMFGAMKIEVIPCSIYPPNPNKLKTDMPKFRGFSEDAGAKYALSTNMFATAMTAASILYKTGVKWIGTDILSIKRSNRNKPKDYENFEGVPEDICFIQYTSGSTGHPKGVRISHQSLAENCIAISAMSGTNASNVGTTVGALWVPQYHDMGLVAGFMTTLYAGTSLVMASPLDFVANPLLWSDMVETYKATLTCAPNFAYALLLKRLEQANRNADWSCVRRAMFGGEPAQSHVVDAVSKTLSINPDHIYNIYGLAESVVFLTGGSAYPDSEGLLCCGEVNSPTLKLRLVEDGKEVEEGQVGSIWAQSPRVAAGYYGQPELTAATFANVLPGYDGSWLDSGDLGKVVDGQLYVTGRVKDVIIINGKNYYPTDVELSIDETFGDVIRPGRTSAFQHGEDSVGITVEGRKDFDKTANEDLTVQISNHVSQLHGLFAAKVVVLKLGVTPKTTSGKLKRSEIRQATIAGDWKESSVLLSFQRQANISPMQTNISSVEKSSFLEQSFALNGVTSSEFYLSEETQHEIRRRSMTLPFGSLDLGSLDELSDTNLIQTNILPSKAVQAVQAVECNPSKLEEYFSELHLSGVSGIEEAWSKAMKTTAVIQAMCAQVLKHLEDKHPTICQLAKTLSENPDWILLDNRTDFLSQLVHQIFVLQWATTFMMDNSACMEQKLQKDAEWEDTHQTTQTVPTELQEMLNLPERDSMYGKLPFFLWIKNRSVVALLNLVLQSLGSAEGPTINVQVGRINNLLCLNMLEAIWVEQKNGHKDNSEVGRRLATNPVFTATTQSKKVLMEHACDTSALNNLYIDWDMHIVAWAGDKNSSSWFLSKLLLPSIIGDVNAHFFYARLISLHLTTQAVGRKLMCKKFHNEPILSRRALHYFGKLNLSCAEKCGYIPLKPESKHQLALDEDFWLSKFDQWGLANHPAKTSTADPRLHGNAVAGSAVPDKVSARSMNTIMSVFGSQIDTSKPWVENGLTSLQSAELRNKIEEELHVVLPANFEQLYPTPEALSNFLEASEMETFPKKEIYNHPDFLWNSSRSRLSKAQLAWLQSLGSIVILLLIVVSIVPSYFLVSWLMDQCDSTKVGECNSSGVWLLLPLAFPLYILSFSIIVVFCKYAVTGTYLYRQIEVLSWGYLQWWFVDRLVEVWESLVGHLVVETKFIWIFYWLLGADLARTTKIKSFIREFDLVKVGGNSVISHPVKCRKFSQSRETGPTITFRPIMVGEKCQVSGMVSLGASIGDDSKVEKLSVVEEGSQVPDGVLARGNPACNAGSFEPSNSKYWEESLLDAFKIVWLFLEAYHYFALSFLVHATLNKILPSWRYASILHWFLLFPFSSFLGLLTSIALKWFLIGKRDASDEYEGSLWRQATNWVCDFHFRVAAWPITPFIGHSKLWNIILFLHGLDVDLRSELNFTPFTKFSPSRVDFVKIRKSFVATITFDFDCKADSKIEIINSSVGYNVNLHSGVKIVRSTIPPRTNLSDSVYDLNKATPKSKSPILMNIFLPELPQQALNMVLFATFIPSCEIVYHATQTSSTWIAMCCFVAAFFTLLCVWILSTRMIEWLMLSLPSKVQESLYGVYINHVWFFRVRNLLELLLSGTPMFSYYARFMGAEVDGCLWYFGNAIYEYGCLHFNGSVIVDSSHVSGHYIDLNGLTLGDTYVSGLLHPGCYARAGSVVNGKENGPWKVFLRSDLGVHDSKPVLKESPQGSMDRLAESHQDDLTDEVHTELDV
ncbi:D-alanine--D-alanyl carrier protein ligase [Seminavis robusta]|uniref:D-alanine--D-alanyl carrier protein ligase n=1 Tax=Seminavis robusta TaxID=568900 RepID=A0A9N8E859_9STRA|nr:D-alanine--D-alanyl carrier protein ligase [Seminavis robusta]|eukprot:Sro653_g181950.1 D-alanine--D-alanyl carrier protein ligase (1802) ;mRNA; f:27972-33544